MNPPTIGHEKLLDAIAKAAGSNPYKIYLSQSQDEDKNPLGYKEKVKIARKMFPRHARNILVDKGAKNLLDRDKPNLFIEIEERHTGILPQLAISEIKSCGYKCFIFNQKFYFIIKIINSDFF